MKKLLRIIRALKAAGRCKDSIVFERSDGRYIRNQVTYDSDRLWTNTELLKMQGLGYTIKETDNEN